MSTLAEIVGLDGDILSEKFDLEPRFCCSPNESDNLVHLSPIILLEDLELRDGGHKDRSAKDVLSRVTKYICDSKDPSLFQIPEIPSFHMGYAKSSENKKRNMAIDHEEAKLWMSYLNLSRFNQDREDEESQEPTSLVEDMEIDPPTAEDKPSQNEEDLVSPLNSGLQFPMKGSLVLMFSILLIFFDKKKRKADSTRSNDDEPKIGANKVSDFLLFRIIPYLCRYTQQKVREIVKHHQEHNQQVFRSVCKKSSFDIIKEAMLTCGFPAELKTTILSKYRDFYGTEQLEYKYDLLKSPENTPVILVPKRYKVTQMPVRLKDIGINWSKLGDITLTKLFDSKFIRNREIQRDFFYSLPLLKTRQGIDYAIILPDEETFLKVTRDLETSCDSFIAPKVCPEGCSDIVLSIGMVTTREKHLSVCFSYPQGTGGERVADLFRAIGAHYLDHFSLVILHGLCRNDQDPDYKVGSLYPVSGIWKVIFKGKCPQLAEKRSFSTSRGKFCRAEFPETYKLWEQEVRKNESVEKVMTANRSSLRVDPKYERDTSLLVGYSKKCHVQKLKKVPFGVNFATPEKPVRSYKLRAVNLNGCLLYNIEKSGRKGNIAVVLCIKDTFGSFGSCLPTLPEATKVIIVNFVRAVVVAGLPKVYPSKPDEEDRDEIERGFPEEEEEMEDMDESSEDETSASGQDPAVKKGYPENDELEQLANDIDPSYSKKVGRKLKIKQDDEGSGSAEKHKRKPPGVSRSSRTKRVKKVNFEDSVPIDDVLEELAHKIGNKWKQLGRRLGFEDDAQLAQIDQAPGLELSQKALRMLKEWKQQKGPKAINKILYEALSHKFVGRTDLAEYYCTEKNSF